MTILSKSSIVIESGIILTEKMRRKIQQEEERMRGVETRIQEIRHAIFTEVAKWRMTWTPRWKRRSRKFLTV